MFRDPLEPTRLLCPWDFPGKNTGGGCYFLLQGIFPTQGWNQRLLWLLLWQVDSLSLSHLGSPMLRQVVNLKKKQHNFIQNMVPPSRNPKLKVGNRESQNTGGKWSLTD